MDDAAKYEEVTNYFKERMAQSKKIAASRGKEARIQAHAAKMASGVTTWRQMKGLSLMAHEATHIGNRPFMFGFAVFTAFTTYAQFKFSDESKANSEYWSTFHGTGKKDAHH